MARTCDQHNTMPAPMRRWHVVGLSRVVCLGSCVCVSCVWIWSSVCWSDMNEHAHDEEGENRRRMRGLSTGHPSAGSVNIVGLTRCTIAWVALVRHDQRG